jgi:propanol-preferring alcohol dehydrogenase
MLLTIRVPSGEAIACLTRQDGPDFLKIVPQAEIRTQTTALPLAEANVVLAKLRTGQILGAAVPKPQVGQ